ncbi:hypothetical protein PZA11_006658 [Diplocarpon coronariae]|uniref:Proteinral stress protein A n=1 Tax=Diplocarpon coronariae TaxID=2795749 RepID=A0A218Z3X2_9HELO|nr:hypothetical protein JHW43_003551 [Diplocarpon mali]OWP02462.1 proteinral stress protein A [Marssonina coronariae]
MAPRVVFLNPDGSVCDGLYVQSDSPLDWSETIPPSQKRYITKLILDHRSWAALRAGELNDLFVVFSSLRELILPIADWGELDTYFGTLQFTKLNSDRIVYHGGDVHLAPLDKFQYDTWTEYKEELELMGEPVMTPRDLVRELALVLRSMGAGVDGKIPTITIWGCRRFEEGRAQPIL